MDHRKLGHLSRPVRVVSPSFKIVFFSILGLTVLLIFIHVGLVCLVSVPTEAHGELVNTVSAAWRMSLGAIVGMLSGKVL